MIREAEREAFQNSLFFIDLSSLFCQQISV